MTPKRYLEIERLRAIAVIWVILHHSVAFSPYVNQLFKQGWTGVDLFFVISGFVVAKSFDSKLPTQDSSSNLMDKLKFYGPHLKTFWGRRIMRIVPLALGWILISSALWQWVPDWQAFAPYEKGYSREIISFLTLQINFINLHQASKFFHYWSLAVEEHFNLLLPFLLVLTRNRSYQLWASIMGILMVIFVIRPYLTRSSDLAQSVYFLHSVSLNRFDSLLAGVVLYLLISGGVLANDETPLSRSSRLIKILFCYLSIYLLWVMPYFYKPEYLFRYNFPIFWFLSSYLVYAAQINQGLVANFYFLNPIFHWIGKRSYGLYVTHMPAQWLHTSLNIHLQSLQTHFPSFSAEGWNAAAYLILLFSLTELSWWLMEKPGIYLGNQWFAKNSRLN